MYSAGKLIGSLWRQLEQSANPICLTLTLSLVSQSDDYSSVKLTGLPNLMSGYIDDKVSGPLAGLSRKLPIVVFVS